MSKFLDLQTAPSVEGGEPGAITINCQTVIAVMPAADPMQAIVRLPPGEDVTVLWPFEGLSETIRRRAGQ